MTRFEPSATRFSHLLLFAAAAATLAGCRSTVQIETLLSEPTRYDGETVRVEGRATTGASVLGRAAYAVDDGTGTLPVISDLGGAPASGAEVEVVGEFRALFSLGDESVAVLMEERRETRPAEGEPRPEETEPDSL